jgi:metal-responsive CopG/Arc/MetJ family transcriptional regulator
VHFNLILPDESGEQLNRVAAEHGFSSPEAFIQAAVQNELDRDAAEKTVDQQLFETLHRLTEHTRRLADDEGTTTPLIHSLSKLIFALNAELESDAFSKAVSMKSTRRRKSLDGADDKRQAELSRID